MSFSPSEPLNEEMNKTIKENPVSYKPLIEVLFEKKSYPMPNIMIRRRR